MPIPLFTNNAATALAVAITPTDTVLQVVAGTGQQFPSPTGGNYFMLTLIQINNPEVGEIVKCIGRTGDFLTVERGQENTQPQIFNISDNVQLRITAQSLNLFAQGGGGGGGAAATQEVSFTATQGQTNFTLPFTYIPDENNLAVFVNGSKQVVDVNYSESSSTTIAFFAGLNVGDIVEVIYGLPIASGILFADNIEYDEGDVGAVQRTVSSKLKEIISSLDFSTEPEAVNAAVGELTGGFWADQTPKPNIRRISDRVFIGDAVYSSGDSTQQASESWVYSAFGAYYFERGAQLFSLPDSIGYIGEFSAVRTSTVDPVGNIGLGMAALGWNDYVGSRYVWAGYFEVSREAGAGVSYGLEIAGKNKGDNHTRTPYALDSSGILGIWMAGGGDPSYNGSSVNPNNTAIAIGKNSNTWNTGICFDHDGLTNSGTNTFSAIKMAQGHQLEWWASTSLQTAIIRSDGADPGAITKYLLFKNTKVSIEANSVTDLFTFDLGGTPANGLSFSAGTSGSNLSAIYATGTDTNIDLQLNPKGSGNIRFGTFTSGAPAATGYIVIKDASGTTRKLLVG
jgi:hypothetical protein